MIGPDLEPSRTANATDERRSCPRYQYASVIRFLLPPSMESRRAVVRDVSVGGLGLHVTLYLPPGTPLIAQLRGVNGMTHARDARVVHATPYQGGGWFLGCEFTLPLSSFDRARTLQFCAEDHVEED